MARYQYQSSAYGEPWKTSREADTPDALLQVVNTRLWLMMLAERHHRIIDTDNGDAVVWFHRSSIAPQPGSKELPV